MLSRLLLVIGTCTLAVLAAACGGDDDAGGPSGSARTSANSTAGGAAPTLGAPASRFAISLDDLEKGYLTDRNATFVLDAKNYGGTKTFPSQSEGETLLNQWGYAGGYETAFEPETRYQGVLNGAYYINVEVHLFKTADGAVKAFDYFENKLKTSPSQKVTADALGNQSSAWKLISGKVPGSNIDAAFHRFIFRRGNLVAVVQTYGSDVFMKVDAVHQLAAIVDEKALGKRTPVEPTPVAAVPTSTPLPAQPSGTPAASATASR